VLPVPIWPGSFAPAHNNLGQPEASVKFMIRDRAALGGCGAGSSTRAVRPAGVRRLPRGRCLIRYGRLCVSGLARLSELSSDVQLGGDESRRLSG
jgi:hypothetical protein